MIIYKKQMPIHHKLEIFARLIDLFTNAKIITLFINQIQIITVAEKNAKSFCTSNKVLNQYSARNLFLPPLSDRNFEIRQITMILIIDINTGFGIIVNDFKLFVLVIDPPRDLYNLSTLKRKNQMRSL